jgi:hypothetical protein
LLVEIAEPHPALLNVVDEAAVVEGDGNEPGVDDGTVRIENVVAGGEDLHHRQQSNAGVGSGTGFSRLSFRGLRDRMCPRPCGTTTTSGSTSIQPAS